MCSIKTGKLGCGETSFVPPQIVFVQRFERRKGLGSKYTFLVAYYGKIGNI
jgi:hypothetical protein